MKATINDVARISGVSIGTVSRVLNDKPGVKPSTRDKVKKVVSELGYIPESAARDLSRGQSLTIGVHLYRGGFHMSPYSVLYFQNIMREIHERGGKVIDLPSRSDGLPTVNVDGILLHGAYQGDPRIDYLDREGIPYVLIGHHMGSSWVSPDDFDGGRQAAEYLLKCGHSSIIHATGRLDMQGSADRFRGFNTALRERGMEVPLEKVLTKMTTSLDAYRIFSQFIKNRKTLFNESTAVFAGTDEIAVGIIAAIEDAGKTVPGDYSVVGYDDMPEIGSNLTTVHQDIPGLAGRSLEMLMDRIEGREPPSVLLPVQLVVRETSGLNIRSM